MSKFQFLLENSILMLTNTNRGGVNTLLRSILYRQTHRIATFCTFRCAESRYFFIMHKETYIN